VRIMRLVVVLSAVLAVVTALSAAGCGSSPAPPANPSGIIGLMVEVGGPPPGSPRPMPHVEIEVRQGDKTGDVVATAKSKVDGTFTVEVPPGHYTVVPIAHGDAMVIAASANVVPGKYAHVVVRFSVR